MNEKDAVIVGVLVFGLLLGVPFMLAVLARAM